MITSFHTKRLCTKILAASAVTTLLIFALAPSPARADWPSTNVTKWVQYPDRTKTGYDVLVAQSAAGTQPLVIADDFLCRQTGPITDIHIWVSWLGDNPDPNLPINLSIWTDIPATTNPPVTISHPGSLVWSQTFGPGQYAIKTWASADEQFWSPDPFPQGMILGQDHLIWQYNFYPTNPFVQQGSPNNPVVYWLAVTAGFHSEPFGWKTATNHWNDDAVFGHLDQNGFPVGDWKELRDPQSATGRSLDMSFALTTREIIPPPPPTNKWVQYPDQFNGFDINMTQPYIVADDFLCKTAGTITNIQIWASWQDDVTPDPNTRFVLGIWSDVSSGTTANTYSHPGTLLWTESFGPNGYTTTFYTNGTERFYSPDTGQLIPETKIWLYNFTPKQPFCQKGSTNNPVVYWLSVWAQPSSPIPIGWKTSTNHFHDDAVYGHLNAAATPVGDWKDLRSPDTGLSLDLAFLLNNGPPNPDCDNNRPKPKFVQWPDPSSKGYDVRATYPKIVGDDFLCKRPAPISAVTVWGSWLGDRVDTNATFELSLWSDVPAIPGTTNVFSHPGQLVCKQTFYPPSLPGTSLMRYNYGLEITNVQENFFDPDLPSPGIIGNDTQIWRYDFYPRLPCWRQDGGPTAPRVYWITLTATTANDQFLFGWKTSTNHWNDDGVWGHLSTAGGPLGDWKDLHDPQPPSQSLDLSFALRTFPIVGINKDLKNTTTQTAIGVRIVVAGIHEVTWHYDDSPPWPIFQLSYAGGNTVLEWTGKTVAPGAITHVGFEMAGTSISIVSMAWLGATGPFGPPIQVNHHTWGNGSVLTLNNNIVGATVGVLAGGTVEFFADPVPLDQMNPNGTRNPLAMAQLPIQPTQLMPGGAMRIPLPQAPAGARYAMFMINLANDQGAQATADFVQMPLDVEARPTIQSFTPSPSAGTLRFNFSTIADRAYRIQQADDLMSSFFDVFTEIMGDGSDVEVTIPIMPASQGFWRIMVVPD